MLSAASRIPFDKNQADVFNKLDDYSLLDILERLTPADLVSVAAVSPRISQLIWDYRLIPELGRKSSAISITVSSHYNKLLISPDGDESNFRALFTKPDSILGTLKAFCPFFARLGIVLDYFSRRNFNFTDELFDHVNRYCATVPQKVTVINAKETIDAFTAQNVSSVTIHSPEALKNFSINGHFPRVERLSILISNSFGITEHLPELKHFELLDGTCGHFDLKTFAEFNPKTRSVKLDLCDGLDDINEVSKIFPDLVSLHYKPKRNSNHASNEDKNTVQLVRFPNVTSYTIDLMDYKREQLDPAFYVNLSRRFSSIRFDQLESLVFISLVNNSSMNQMGFVSQYKDLIRLDFSSYELCFEEVKRLVYALPSLKEIRIKPNKQHAEYLRLMQETNLDIIRLRVDDASANEFRRFTLPGTWFLQTVDHGTLPLRFNTLTYKRNKML